MNLKELGLNRLLLKDSAIVADSSIANDSSSNTKSSDNSTAIASLSTKTNDSIKGEDSLPKEKTPAGNVLTGTVITSCPIKTSNSGDRIEIAASIDISSFPTSFVFPLGFIDSDSIIVYDGTGQDFNVLINRFGIFTSWIYANDMQIGGQLVVDDIHVMDSEIIENNLNVKGFFTYGGKIQPVNFKGYVKYDATASTLPSGWSVSKLGTGQYEITHNFGSTNYTVTVTDKTEAGGPATLIVYSISNFSSNSFEVLSFDYLGTGATDASFFFQVMKTA